MGLMSAVFAHEIRNSLTSLKTFAQLFPEKYNDADFRDSFSRIVPEQIKIVDRLIKDFLDCYTKEKDDGSKGFNLTETFNESVESVKNRLRLEEKNIVIEKKYGNNAINMPGSAGMLKYAFANILDNGCQAMEGEGALKVDIETNGKFISVMIEDTGDGISSEDINKIFDPFYTTKSLGIGLGLAISKRIIEDYGGMIRVKSRLAEGTVFQISLPVVNNNIVLKN